MSATTNNPQYINCLKTTFPQHAAQVQTLVDAGKSDANICEVIGTLVAAENMEKYLKILEEFNLNNKQ